MATRASKRVGDDHDRPAADETVVLGWQGEWRELDLTRRDRKALATVFDRYWHAARPQGDDAA